jgi:hypothetical protein
MMTLRSLYLASGDIYSPLDEKREIFVVEARRLERLEHRI